MSKLDHYQIGVSVPYAAFGWTQTTTVTGLTRVSVTVDWACMKDSPFTLPTSLPAQ
jgi:hypothetical protein